jgi:hypothetical protein
VVGELARDLASRIVRADGDGDRDGGLDDDGYDEDDTRGPGIPLPRGSGMLAVTTGSSPCRFGLT